jgi:hypothetical protein
MAMHGEKPFVHVSDSNGNPYVAAKLYVYEVGTTTLRSIYSNDGLSVALANPLTSDAAGNFDRFYQNSGTYKLRCETSAEVLIWEHDNIDTGLPAGTGALPISRGGTGATTAAAARAALDVPSNSELTDLASDISDLSAQVQNVISIPQGYLTLTSLTPVITGDVSAGTSVYYTPSIGNLIPIYNGTSFVVTTFTELTLALNANHLANTIYDLYIINDSGTVRLVTGPAWNTSTAGSGAIGSGAGTAERERLNGLLVNKVSATMRYGATTLTVDARKGTLVGSIFMDGTNGQVTCHRSVGQNRKWGIWNLYGQKRISLLVRDSTGSWTYGTATIRQSNGAAGNKATVFQGLQDGPIRALFTQRVKAENSTSQETGIGQDSTTAYATVSKNSFVNLGAIGVDFDVTADFTMSSGVLGVSNVNCLEKGGGAGTNTFYGAGAFLMTVEWMA